MLRKLVVAVVASIILLSAVIPTAVVALTLSNNPALVATSRLFPAWVNLRESVPISIMPVRPVQARCRQQALLLPTSMVPFMDRLLLLKGITTLD